MTKRSDFLRGQLDAYREAWKKDHDEAMEYWDLQGRLQVALSLFRYIGTVAEHWADLIRSGGREYQIDEAREIGALYRDWLIPSEEVLKAIRRVRKMGFAIDEEQSFINASHEATFAAEVDPARIVAARRQLDAGGGYSIEQVLHELQSRVFRNGA